MNDQLANKIRQKMSGGEGHHHLSPSSLSIPLPKFFINYLMFTQEERRQQLAGYKAHYGNACNNPVQRFLCKYIFEGGKKLTPKKKTLDQHIADEFKIVDDIPPRDERDVECRKEMKQYVKPTAELIVKALKEIFGDQELMAERYVHTNEEGLKFDLLGRIDYESGPSYDALNNLIDAGSIVELKTKPINFRQTKNGLSSYKQKLPEYVDEQEAHLKQLAFYYKATGKTPYLVYANHEEYKIFKPELPQLEYYYQQMINKAFIIQNLLEITEADMNKISQLVEPPDFKSFYYSDLNSSQIERVKEVWRL